MLVEERLVTQQSREKPPCLGLRPFDVSMFYLLEKGRVSGHVAWGAGVCVHYGAKRQCK